MVEQLFAAGLILLGAVLGAVSTYFASYALERRKWAAEAALRRKDAIYSPIYDELSAELSQLRSFPDWVRATSHHIAFESWDKVRSGSDAFQIPADLLPKLEEFKSACDVYSKCRGAFYQDARSAFPGRHEGIDDFSVAIVLSEKMLMASSAPDQIAYEYVVRQQTITKDSPLYWTSSALEVANAIISQLSSWPSLTRAHSQYASLVPALHKEIGRRIQRIVKAYHPPRSRQ